MNIYCMYIVYRLPSFYITVKHGQSAKKQQMRSTAVIVGCKKSVHQNQTRTME